MDVLYLRRFANMELVWRNAHLRSRFVELQEISSVVVLLHFVIHHPICVKNVPLVHQVPYAIPLILSVLLLITTYVSLPSNVAH